MALLTVFCDKLHIGLEEQQKLLNGGLLCPICGLPLQVVPVCSFSEDDREVFNDMRQVVTERTVGAQEAKALAADIAAYLRSGANHALLERLTGRFPGLLPIQLVAGGSRPAVQRALKVLRAILEAKALGERAESPPMAKSVDEGS